MLGIMKKLFLMIFTLIILKNYKKQLRTIINKTRLVFYGIDLQYRPGDIVISDLEEKFDFEKAIWFVTSEIHDPSSPSMPKNACWILRKMWEFPHWRWYFDWDLPRHEIYWKILVSSKENKIYFNKSKDTPPEKKEIITNVCS